MKDLHYLRCPKCKRLCARARRFFEKERCDLCQNRMEHLYTVPVETVEQQILHAKGVVYNPHPGRSVLTTCSRCEEQFTKPLTLRGGKPCCTACWHAEVPPARLLNEQEQLAHLARKAAARREMDAEMERAIARADQQEQTR